MRNQTRGTAIELAADIWRRRKWLALVVFAWTWAGAASGAMSLPDIYRSTATVLVDRQQVPESFVRPSVTGELETRLHTISQEILSRARLGSLITRFDLYPVLRKRVPLEGVIESMRNDIRLDIKAMDPSVGRGGTVAFTVSYRGRDPETVARVTNALASFYVAENVKIRERQASETAQFLRSQLAEAKRRLDEQERRVDEFTRRYGSELPQQAAVNLSTLQRLNAELSLVDNKQMRAIEQRAALMRSLAEAGSEGAVARPETPADRLARLRLELARLRRHFSDKYPDVVQMKADVAALEQELLGAHAGRDVGGRRGASDGSAVRPPLSSLDELEAEIKSLKLEDQRLRREIATYQRRVENTPERQQEFLQQSREYEAAKELYASLWKRYEDAQVAKEMEQRTSGEEFRVLDSAVPARHPAAPNRMLLLVVGLLASLGAASLAVMVAERLDTSFHTVDDLRTFTRVSILAGIPRILTPGDARHRMRQCWLATASVAAGLVVVVLASSHITRANEQLVSMLGGLR